MSIIKVGIKIRSPSEREIKVKKEEKWVTTDKNSLQCVDFLNPCHFTFDHLFDKKCSNQNVYSSIVNPVVESCLTGFNGTIFTYGPISSGKNHTMMGTDDDPGIMLYALQYLFTKTDTSAHHERKIRVSYIEIYKEKVYDLLNDRKPIAVDLTGDIALPNEEILVETDVKAIDTLVNGSFKRKSSSKDPQKLSCVSHAIFRIAIETQKKSDASIRKSYLKFVHVAPCGPITEVSSADYLLKKSADDNKGLLWLNFLMKGLSEGKQEDINFNNSTLTALLKESLIGNSTTAIVCHIRSDVIPESLMTLQFASYAKSVRTMPTRCPTHNIQTRQQDGSNSVPVPDFIEQRLLERVDVKVENLMLHRKLEELQSIFKSREKWFEDQMKAAAFAQQKLELAHMEEKKLFDINRMEWEQKVASLNDLNQDLQTKYEALQKSYSDSTSSILKQNETLILLRKENLHLKSRNEKLADNKQMAEEVELGIKRKIDRLTDDLTKNIKMLKSEIHSKKDEREPSTSSSIKSDETNASHTITVPNHLVGCIIGPGGSIMKSIYYKTGAKLVISDRKGNSYRNIQIDGTVDSVSHAVELIQQKIKYADHKISKR